MFLTADIQSKKEERKIKFEKVEESQDKKKKKERKDIKRKK